jgi:cytochrome c oxidase subunit 2
MRTLIAACTLVVFAIAMPPAALATKVVRVTAERFRFTPDEIKMRLGETLELHLDSDDTNHGFHIAGTDIRRVLPKRGQGEIVVTFTPDRAGRYAFECSKVCGAGHEFMHGAIIVEQE